MAYCQNCGAAIDINANFCSSCGAAQKATNAQTQNAHHSNIAKTVATAAGTALGMSMLSRKLHRRRRSPMPFTAECRYVIITVALTFAVYSVPGLLEEK